MHETQRKELFGWAGKMIFRISFADVCQNSGVLHLIAVFSQLLQKYRS